MPYKMIQVGCGGFGGSWCRRFLPPNVTDGLIEVVAAADANPDALKNAREGLGLTAASCYTDVDKAFDENDADFCTIVVPPAFHESIVDIALAHDCHILSEKPIADTLAASLRIAGKVRSAGLKMGVTMSHRFRQDITTLRRLVQSGQWGPVDYLVCRFTCALRKFGSWGKFRHEIPDPLMVEGAVHHLDLLADLAGGKCETIYAQTWNPAWGQYAGDSQALVLMHVDSGARAFYEGAKCNAAGLNGWGQEYIRAECEKATFVLSHGKIERLAASLVKGEPTAREAVELIEQPKWAHAWLIEKFCKWLDGGEPMETNVQDNLQSVALIFSAIESSRTDKPIRVQEFLGA
ncbi:MAG: Gfo/Idh/MocA family oxidoreductase [Planctomycetes bacterium]|nr:Gfo/Idh/MocA family oxidoreductase [Planctomycetota bacterium]